MSAAQAELIEKLAAEGIEKCLRRLSAASPAAWRLLKVSAGEPDPHEPRTCTGREAVRITVEHPAPLATALLFSPAEADALYRCFIREDMAAALGPDRRLVTLLELGNILLNSPINALLKALRTTAIPSVPEHFPAGGNPCLPAPGAKPPYITLTASISAERGVEGVKVTLLVIIPAGLLANLSAA